MVKTEWKSPSEIRFNIGDVKSVTILSCATCANLSGTGGREGVRYMRRLLEGWGVKVIAARIITFCCPLAIMDNAIKRYRKLIDKSEAIIVLACSSGVKSAMVCAPTLKVISVLNTVGTISVGQHSEDPRANSLCQSCQQCVITFTNGLCPIAECPRKMLYGPCEDAPGEGRECVVDPKKECVWVKIRERGDPERIAQLKLLRSRWERERNLPRPPLPQLSTPRARSRLGKRLANGLISRIYGRSVLKID
jgi:hypothetical protein